MLGGHTQEAEMKADLHLHSKHSRRPAHWVLQKLGCPESFSEPEVLFRLTQRAGMGAFTLTDHNTIDGCLETAHLPGAFISEEVTTYFPEDRCKLHVLVWGIDQEIHLELQRLRENVFDLVAYLRQEGLAHALAHPLYSINGKLSPEHFERVLLLFSHLELNGARDEAQNRVLELICRHLTPQLLAELAERHRLEPSHPEPWRKVLVAGSDDHSALGAARRHTEAPEADGPAGLLAAVRAGRCRPRGRGSSPRSLAHTLYGIAYQYYNQRFGLERYLHGQVLLRFLDRLLKPEPQAPRFTWRGWSGRWMERGGWRRRDRLQDVLKRESERLIRQDPELSAILRGRRAPGAGGEEQWFDFVERVSNRVLRRLGERLYGHLSGANVFSIFESMGGAGSLLLMMSPYFVPFGLFSRDRQLSRRIAGRLLPPPEARRLAPGLKAAHFTDTLYETNGVARTLAEQARLAQAQGKDLTLYTCAESPPSLAGRVRNLKPLATYPLPMYPDQKLFLPPFLRLLNELYEEGFTYLHSATPGPVGLAALGAARILQLPISGTYHTAVPQYASHLTGDQGLEELSWRYILWYYDQMDRVYAPSRHTADELVGRGLSPDKVRVYPRGVDTEVFHPRWRGPELDSRLGLSGEVKLLYVGRVSREKSLPVLVEAFKSLAGGGRPVHLVVVGEGPYLEEMRAELAGWPASFTGRLEGRELARAYASCEVFLFPSTTDTFGNVVMEAQASGLPVVVTDAGGPAENVEPGRTGLVVPGGDPAELAAAAEALAANPLRRREMGRQARAAMEKRSFGQAFQALWALYEEEAAQPRPAEETPAWARAVGSDLA
jgi:glycosyltransferase involved in cell wall biosynthesis